MSMHKYGSAAHPTSEVPFLLKSQSAGAEQRVPTALTGNHNVANGRVVAPPPPSAGFNPYFDLPPDLGTASFKASGVIRK